MWFGVVCGLFFSRERSLGDVLENHSPQIVFSLSGDQLSHAPIPFFKPVSVQNCSAGWDDWTSVLLRVACDLVSLIDFHTMPEQHSQPTPISLGHARV